MHTYAKESQMTQNNDFGAVWTELKKSWVIAMYLKR